MEATEAKLGVEEVGEVEKQQGTTGTHQEGWKRPQNWTGTNARSARSLATGKTSAEAKRQPT